MNPDPTRLERARMLRAQRHRRIALIRKRVTALSVAGFIALFSTIYVQMAAGHDPALSTKSASTPTTKAPSVASQSESEDTPAVAPAPVITAQS